MAEQQNPLPGESPYRLEVEMHGSKLWTLVRHVLSGELVCSIDPNLVVIGRRTRCGDPEGPMSELGVQQAATPIGTFTYDRVGPTTQLLLDKDSIVPPKSTDEPPPDAPSIVEPPR